MPNLEILAQHNRERLAKAKEQYLGKTFSSNNFGDFIVVDYVNSNNITIKFIDTNYICKTRRIDIIRGSVKDRHKPSIYGVGIVGDKYPTSKHGKDLKEYKIWRGILQRCYDLRFQEKRKTYKDCTVSENFKSYEYFYDWFNSQTNSLEKDYHVDKDLLIKGNKVYSEDTCVLLPSDINALLVKSDKTRGEHLIGVSFHKKLNKFSAQCNSSLSKHIGYFNTEIEAFNAYKQVKENYLKEVAEKWKGKIDERAYNALMSYQVEITD